MTPINGTPGSLGKPLDWVEDLIYYDGPLLSILRDNATGQQYLRNWCDIEWNEEQPEHPRVKADRFAIFAVSDEAMLGLTGNSVTMRETIERSGPYFFVDYDRDCNIAAEMVLDSFPEEYMPEVGCYLRW